MKRDEVPLSPSLNEATQDVRSGLTAANVVGAITWAAIFLFFIGVCAWRALFLPADIWTLWTPWWLIVGFFLVFSYDKFLDFLLTRLRNHMVTFLWVLAIVILVVLLIVGGAVFWIWELVVYCYGNHDYFCYNVNGVPWNVWFAFGTYWATVLFLIIQSVIVGNTLKDEGRRLRLTPLFTKPVPMEVESQLEPARIVVSPGVGSMAQALIHQANERKFK
jgi:hypothetical protein